MSGLNDSAEICEHLNTVTLIQQFSQLRVP